MTINYRLGALGFLAHPALTGESPDRISGNYGFQDQQAAMKWVRRNIRAFGGNPEKVTIFGESAGGLSTFVNLVSPTARGLFDRAIVESGAYLLAPPTLAQAQVAGTSFANAVAVQSGQSGGCAHVPARAAGFDDPRRRQLQPGAQHRRQDPDAIDQLRARERAVQSRAADERLQSRRVEPVRGARLRSHRPPRDRRHLSGGDRRHDRRPPHEPGGGARPGAVSGRELPDLRPGGRRARERMRYSPARPGSRTSLRRGLSGPSPTSSTTGMRRRTSCRR